MLNDSNDFQNSYPILDVPSSLPKAQWQLLDLFVMFSLFFVGLFITFLGSWTDSPVEVQELSASFAAIRNVGEVLSLGGPIAYFILRWFAGKFLRVIAAVESVVAFTLFFKYAGTLFLPDYISWSIVISLLFALLYTGIRIFILLKYPQPLPKN